MTGFPLLPGAHAALVESLVPMPAPGALPASLFLAPGGTARLLAAARLHRPGADERAMASLWSRWYFAKLIPPVLMCGVLARRSLPLSPVHTAVVLGEDGLPRAIALPHSGEVLPEPDPFARFASLVHDHVAVVVRGLAAHARLAPRILWNNAAVYADWALRHLAEEQLVAPDMVRAALVLVENQSWSDGDPNPIHAPFTERAGADGPCRIRRQCCLRYRLAGEAPCRTCPRTGARATLTNRY
ncbi:siderophore-iron reductase FhuF [Sabulicella rubraurantiaca]|uniref:siderophore-iron reductase FhuF n=1 Tax=Sabulicella rubraurantiaca TaxID=2811429 RepID=UPI001A96B8BD|nr:siderophore-iron reductase FhuF [Sabulicella rubraurantiaca]